MSDPGGTEVDRLLRGRLAELAGQVRRAEAMVRAEEAEGVHDLRVAMRRARSLLVSFEDLLRWPATQRLVEDLRWSAAELSGLRDVEVVQERLEVLLVADPVELLLGPVSARVADHVRAARASELVRVQELLADNPPRLLADELERVVAEAPGSASVDDVRRRLRQDWRRTRRRAGRAAALPAGDRALDAALHDVRKAAKRARYAAETLKPLLGERAEEMEKAAEAVQQALGDHRDTLLTRAALRQMGVQAHLDRQNGFSFGRMHALEQVAGEGYLEVYATARDRLDAKRLRRWLR
ncbi:CHAD domain-containing protein [Nocardioides mesophilus]|uniref:CHAD domain-containing protein n=1 Tax=Nocardioides mesophilus TaxID=433659 RepID=A0A7G9R7M8_9ACTN|nr:CHAD domain-containing protein [Nocardioides mesophilus]QNN51603.1 CHAD domain-containing protein [Nocardioides mesophilus]